MLKIKKAEKKIVFFDFDGVIADSFDVVFWINNDSRVKTKDDFANLFDGNINDWKKGASYGPDEIKKIDDEFFARYISKMGEVKVFPGMKETARELAGSYTLIIISSMLASLVKDFLERNDMLRYFEEFESDNVVYANKTERIKKVFKKYGIGPKDCVFITDTLGDMREASSCGVSSIGVAWGFQKKENLLGAKPFKIVENPKELILAVYDYFKTLELPGLSIAGTRGERK
jgi:phosphoglycolate phosphatase-like HAD superfamily hydrolase